MPERAEVSQLLLTLPQKSPQSLFKPGGKGTSTPLRHLAFQIFAGLVLTTEKQSKHSVSQRCPQTKITALKQ